jgi:hypothetical protein
MVIILLKCWTLHYSQRRDDRSAIKYYVICYGCGPSTIIYIIRYLFFQFITDDAAGTAIALLSRDAIRYLRRGANDQPMACRDKCFCSSNNIIELLYIHIVRVQLQYITRGWLL